MVEPISSVHKYLTGHRGRLYKQGNVRKQWRPKYFVLERRHLRFFTDETLFRLNGEIVLDADTQIYDIPGEVGGQKFLLLVTSKKARSLDDVLYLSAASQRDKAEWLVAIDDALHDGFKLIHQPDLFPEPFYPSVEVEVVYEGGTVYVEHGNLLSACLVEREPVVLLRTPQYFSDDADGSVFSLLMIDLDSIHNESRTTYLHWALVNITHADVKTGVEVAHYQPPAPEHDSGLHRYFLFLFRQHYTFTPAQVENIECARDKFSLMGFVEKYHVGQPVGVNGYLAGWEERCDLLHRLLDYAPPQEYRLRRAEAVEQRESDAEAVEAEKLDIFREQTLQDLFPPSMNIEARPLVESLVVNIEFGAEIAFGGQLLTPTITAQAPMVSYVPHEARLAGFDPANGAVLLDVSMYCLLLVDLDSPSRKEPSMREYVHWALLNIPGNDLQRGVEVAAYQGPAPSKGSGQHRYVLCLYKQKRAFTPQQCDASRSFFAQRGALRTYEWVRGHSAVLLNLPVGLEAWLCEWDDSVDVAQRLQEAQRAVREVTSRGRGKGDRSLSPVSRAKGSSGTRSRSMSHELKLLAEDREEESHKQGLEKWWDMDGGGSEEPLKDSSRGISQEHERVLRDMQEALERKQRQSREKRGEMVEVSGVGAGAGAGDGGDMRGQSMEKSASEVVEAPSPLGAAKHSADFSPKYAAALKVLKEQEEGSVVSSPSTTSERSPTQTETQRQQQRAEHHQKQHAKTQSRREQEHQAEQHRKEQKQAEQELKHHQAEQDRRELKHAEEQRKQEYAEKHHLREQEQHAEQRRREQRQADQEHKQKQAEQEQRHQQDEQEQRHQQQAEQHQKQQQLEEEQKQMYANQHHLREKEQLAEQHRKEQKQAEQEQKHQQAQQQIREQQRAEEELKHQLAKQQHGREQEQKEEQHRREQKQAEQELKHQNAEQQRKEQREAEEQIREQQQAEEQHARVQLLREQENESEKHRKEQKQAEQELRHQQAEQQRKEQREVEEQIREQQQAEEQRREQQQAEEEQEQQRREQQQAEEEQEQQRREQQQAEEEQEQQRREQQQAEEEQKQAEEEQKQAELAMGKKLRSGLGSVLMDDSHGMFEVKANPVAQTPVPAAVPVSVPKMGARLSTAVGHGETLGQSRDKLSAIEAGVEVGEIRSLGAVTHSANFVPLKAVLREEEEQSRSKAELQREQEQAEQKRYEERKEQQRREQKAEQQRQIEEVQRVKKERAEREAREAEERRVEERIERSRKEKEWKKQLAEERELKEAEERRRREEEMERERRELKLQKREKEEREKREKEEEAEEQEAEEERRWLEEAEAERVERARSLSVLSQVSGLSDAASSSSLKIGFSDELYDEETDGWEEGGVELEVEGGEGEIEGEEGEEEETEEEAVVGTGTGMRTSTDTALQGFSNHHTHTPLAFPSSTGDVFEDSKHFIDNVFGNGEDKGLTKSVSENGDYGNGIDDDGNLDSGSGSPHSLKSGSTGFNSGGSRVESDDRRDLESEEMDVGISMFDNSQLDEEEEQEEVEEVEEVEEEKYVEEEMEDEHGADFGVGADGLHEHDIISNKLSSTSSRSQSVKMTTVRELEIEEGEVDEEVELEPQQQEEELLQPLPLPLPLPLPSKEKHAAKQKARKAKKQAREGPGEVLTLALPNPSSLYPSSPFPPSPISPPSPASRSSISLAKEEQKGESERTGVEDSEKGAESGVRRRGEAREVGSKGVSVSPQLSSAQLCQHFGVRNTAIFEGDAISKKFSTDYRAKDSVVWVNAPTLSLHWGKKGKDLANSKYVQLDRHRNGGIPLGENKGSAKALVRVGAGLTVTCWSGRTLDLKLASVKAAQEWEQVIEALQG